MNLHFAEFQGSTCACRPFRLSIVGKISPLSLRRFLCRLPRCNNRLAISGGCDDGYVLPPRSRGLVICSRREAVELSPSEPRLVGIPCRKRSRRLPAGQTILNAIGNLLAGDCQVEEFLFAEDIFGFFSKLPIHRRLMPKVIIPIHACHDA